MFARGEIVFSSFCSFFSLPPLFTEPRVPLLQETSHDFDLALHVRLFSGVFTQTKTRPYALLITHPCHVMAFLTLSGTLHSNLPLRSPSHEH